MTRAARRAFGHARVHALHARLLRREDGERLRAARDPLLVARAFGIEAADAGQVSRAFVARLVADAEKLVRAYPEAGPLLFAIVGLHEVENLKLGWRAVARGLAAERWTGLWRPLGRLARLRPEAFRESSSLRQVSDALARTPYALLAAETLRAHPDDPAAAEMAFDRWASLRIVEAARALPPGEEGARRLCSSLVRERDLDALLRAPARGLSPAAAAGATALLQRELNPEVLRTLAEAAVGAPLPRLPRHFPRAAGLADLALVLRRERGAACARAFRGEPFLLAPPVALLLLRDAEARAVAAFCEEPRSDAGLLRAVAGTALGA